MNKLKIFTTCKKNSVKCRIRYQVDGNSYLSRKSEDVAFLHKVRLLIDEKLQQIDERRPKILPLEVEPHMAAFLVNDQTMNDSDAQQVKLNREFLLHHV